MPLQKTTQLVRRGLLLVKLAPDQRGVSLEEAEAALSAAREHIGFCSLATAALGFECVEQSAPSGADDEFALPSL